MKQKKPRKPYNPNKLKPHPNTDAKKAVAIAMLAPADRTIRSVIAELGISRTQFFKWRQDPLFDRLLEESRAAYAKRFFHIGLVNKEQRLMHLNDMHERLMEVIEERAESPIYKEAPGGSTGLIVKTIRIITPKGKPPIRINEYKVDTATLAELREIQRDVAEEMGQLTQKHELTGLDGKPLQPPQINVNFVAVAAGNGTPTHNKDAAVQQLPQRRQDGLQASR